MSSSDSEDEIPISSLVAGKATPKNGKNGAARDPAAPAGDEAPAPAKAEPARKAKSTTEAIFDEPDSDDDVPIGQMTKQNGAAKAEPAEAPPATKPKPKPKPKPRAASQALSSRGAPEALQHHIT